MFDPKYLGETYRKLGNGGLLLVSKSKAKKRPNVMTIGWGFVGILWGKPFFIIAVRKSRYTHRCIEATMDFTVNVPGKGMGDMLQYCGAVSGREHDKFEERGLVIRKTKKISSPAISGSSIIYECKVLYKADLNRSLLPSKVLSEIYSDKDFHTFYFGEIVACYRGRRG
jgi:flavin reductase (DIM6/NTAB) family NADH-FMN oxidoreductase RutF